MKSIENVKIEIVKDPIYFLSNYISSNQTLLIRSISKQVPQVVLTLNNVRLYSVLRLESTSLLVVYALYGSPKLIMTRIDLNTSLDKVLKIQNIAVFFERLEEFDLMQC